MIAPSGTSPARGYRTDINFHPLHEARFLTCPRLRGYRMALLIDSNTGLLTDGIRRRVP
jgi:hypothetical protein